MGLRDCSDIRKLVYCPLLYRYDKGIWPPVCPATKYFEWQYSLWQWFCQREDLEVVWMSISTSNLIDPIASLKADNIRYSMRRLDKELKKADALLVDFPSTPFWDGMKRGMLVLCTYVFSYPNQDVDTIMGGLFDEKTSVSGLNLKRNKGDWINIVMEELNERENGFVEK